MFAADLYDCRETRLMVSFNRGFSSLPWLCLIQDSTNEVITILIPCFELLMTERHSHSSNRDAIGYRVATHIQYPSPHYDKSNQIY